MKKRTKLWSTGVSVLTLGALLAGCGTTSSGGNSANKVASGTANTSGGTVDLANAKGSIIWYAGPITHSNMRKTLIDKFMSEHPNIKVTIVDEPPNTDTTRTQLTTQIGGGSTTPDVYLGDVIWPAQFGQAQLAAPLNKYLPKSFFDRFAGGLVQGATYKGNVYAAPFFVDSGFLYYRKDLLQKAGLSVPQTWDEVQKDGAILQQKGLVQNGFVWQGASYEGLTCDFMEYLTDAGGKVLGSNGKAAINSPEGQKALNFMKGLIDSGVSPKAETTFHEAEAMDTFDAGNAAFLRNWDYAWSTSQDPANSKVVGKVGVEPLPSFNGPNGYATIGGWDFYVNPHTKNMAASLAFIDWMTGKEAQMLMATKYSMIPTNAEVQADPAVKKVNPVMGIVSDVHFVSRPDQSPNYPQISQAIYQNVNQALAGGVSVDTALKAAETQINSAVGGNSGL